MELTENQKGYSNVLEQFSYSFADSTVREIDYSKSQQFNKFLYKCIILCKKRDNEYGLTQKDLNRRGMQNQSKKESPN